MLGQFADLAARKGTGTSFDRLIPITPSDRFDSLDAPPEYVNFLREIGWGELGNANFMLYSSPVDIDEFLGTSASIHRDIFIVGDDFAGYGAGYRRGSPLMLEVDPNGEILETSMGFADFMRDQIAQLELGR